jgi:putative membrane protein
VQAEPPVETEQAVDPQQTLAFQRTILANERTLLAYIRTALALLILGISLLQFFASFWMQGAGWMCILSGVGLLAVGFARFRRQSERIAQMQKSGSIEGE